MRYSYKTRGTCSKEISFDLDGQVVRDVRFTGGCDGNLQALTVLTEGMTVEQIEAKLRGIDCDGRGTSCPDQLARALRAALAEERRPE
ncbi:MAG: TIGR03905 family TSCPD domain-containing protein [Gracilibacteraceae bacterium]|jgi:uncharacterized protein (TIGR03905 family)|nr:TIGR03905 family TSCPD domain-containing protein [Gracilibacteraceae bacterium]